MGLMLCHSHLILFVRIYCCCFTVANVLANLHFVSCYCFAFMNPIDWFTVVFSIVFFLFMFYYLRKPYFSDFFSPIFCTLRIISHRLARLWLMQCKLFEKLYCVCNMIKKGWFCVLLLFAFFFSFVHVCGRVYLHPALLLWFEFYFNAHFHIQHNYYMFFFSFPRV